LKIIREELFSQEKEALQAISELLDVVSIFCLNGGISEMNVQKLRPLIVEVQHKQEQIPPLHYLYKNTRETMLFEDFLIALIETELKHLQQKTNSFSYESSVSYKFMCQVQSFTSGKPSSTSLTFLCQMMQKLGMQCPQGFFPRFLSKLKKEDNEPDWSLAFKTDQMRTVVPFVTMKN
jgi:hypothetical protein